MAALKSFRLVLIQVNQVLGTFQEFFRGWNVGSHSGCKYTPAQVPISRGVQSRNMRHMTTSPEKGPVVLIYGCSECNWIYRPKTPQEASQMSWVAQVNFDQHDCSKPNLRFA